jgi:hypothetical protein
MANREHVKTIKEGVPIWNKWRLEHPDIVPNLDGASLNRANLDGANLNRANLNGANLDGASLNRANLDGANLDGANLYKTGVKEVISLLPFAIVVLDDNKVRIGCGEPKTIKECLKYTEDEAHEKGLPRDRYALYQAILKGLLK